ncbi:MAG: glycosyltransferase family 39 protein [Candidatus Paceibacterota bacterium]
MLTKLTDICFKKNTLHFIAVAILIFVAGLSLMTLTTKPRLWIDEGLSLELVRNFLDSSHLDIQISPEHLSGFPELLQATGYPVTLSLALFLKLFSFGAVQARLFMLMWMIGVLIFAYFLAKKFFNERTALYSLALIATFATFHAIGRTVTGEIPGFLLLLIGIYYWLEKKQYYVAGFFWGLAVVAKPSVFILIIPTIFLVLLFERKEFFKKIFKIGLAMIPSAALWIFIVLNHPFVLSTWQKLGNFYKNPYDSSISENVIRNLLMIPKSTTFIYFGFLFLFILAARYFLSEPKLKSVYNFVIIYTGFAFIYYLRSPGWMRYLLIAELLILFVLPHAVMVVNDLLKKRLGEKYKTKALDIFLCLLICIQTFQFFTEAQIVSSDSPVKTAEYLNSNFSTSSIAVFKILEVTAFLNTPLRYNILDLTGIPKSDPNFVFDKNSPEIVVSEITNDDFIFVKSIIDSKYEKINQIGKYSIFKLKVKNGPIEN